jgi:hypothetical protein
MHRPILLVLIALTAVVPVFASTTASTCMNITVTVEQFVMAQFSGNVSLTITQSEIERHPTDARLAEAAPASGTLHIQTNYNCDLTLILNPVVGGNGPAPATLNTGIQGTSLTVDGVPVSPGSGVFWGETPFLYFSTQMTSIEADLGPTAKQEGGDLFWYAGRDYVLGFNLGAQNRASDDRIPAWGTYTGSLCATMTPEEAD